MSTAGGLIFLLICASWSVQTDVGWSSSRTGLSLILHLLFDLLLLEGALLLWISDDLYTTSISAWLDDSLAMSGFLQSNLCIPWLKHFPSTKMWMFLLSLANVWITRDTAISSRQLMCISCSLVEHWPPVLRFWLQGYSSAQTRCIGLYH